MSIQDYNSYYQDAGNRYGVDPALLMAQGQVESGGDPNAISDAGAIGIAQLMPATAKSLRVDPTDPKQAIDGQARLMAQNIQRYGDIPTALKAYNGGTNPDNWNNPETQQYPTKVLKNYKGTQTASNQPMDEDEQLAAQVQKELQAKNGNVPSVSQPNNAPDEDEQLAAQVQKELADKATAAKTYKVQPLSTDEDLLKTIPSAVAKGVGILPQLPAMFGNAIANSLGYATGKILGVPTEMQNKLSNINPFFTGNTLPDALIQSGKAIATGNPGEQNPLSGDILYNPQTTSGKLLQAGIEGGIAGPVAGGAGVPSALAGIAGEGASQALPNNPIAPLIAGGLTYAGGKGISNALTPTALPADQATVIKNAENDFGIKTPASAMTNGSNAIERLASKSDNQDLTGQVNKTTNDLMGANDNGEGHTVVNQKSYLDAAKNNSAAYDKVFADIGNIPIDKQIVPILQEVENGGNSARLKSVVDSIQSKLNPDGTLPADAYKELTKVGANGKASVLQQIASSPTETDAAIAAQNILGHLDTALTEHATPEQQATLNAIDTRYKTQKAMEPVARQVGAGSQATIPTIQNVLNKEFSSINNSALPPIEFSNYLNTINPGSKTTGGFPGIKNTPERGGNALSNSEYAAAVASGNPYLAFAPLVQKGVGIAASKAASKYINTDWYKNRLLENAQ